VSRKFVGIGVVVAGIVASVAVGGYVTRQPVLPAVTAPATQEQQAQQAQIQDQISVPEREPVPAPVSARRRPAPATPPVTKVVSAPPSVPPPPPAAPVVASEPAPTLDAPKAEPPRYIPDPVPPPQAPAAEPEPLFDEVTVARHSVIGIRLDFSVSTRTARVEDRISATVSRNVTVNDRVAIPEGARLEGTVTMVDRGGKFRDRPRLGLQFDTMILTDGTRMSIRTDAIIREGDTPSADAAARVGASSAVGAILGGLLGGKKGAIIGGAAGAAGGTATVMNGDGNETALKAGAPLTVRLTDDLTVIVRKQ
jgi:hypothetical protein